MDQAVGEVQERLDMLERNVDVLCNAFASVLQLPSPQTGPEKATMLQPPAASPLAQSLQNICVRISGVNDIVTTLIHRNTL
jgi:hypothetical protein